MLSTTPTTATPAAESGGLDDDFCPSFTIQVAAGGRVYSMTRRAATLSELLREMPTADDTNHYTFPESSNFKPVALDFVVEYLQHYDGTMPPPPRKPLLMNDMNADLCEWDVSFMMRVHASHLANVYSLMYAANYLGVTSLLDLAAVKVASLIKGKPLDALREILKLPSDTPKELVQVQLFDPRTRDTTQL
jgi:hypothetical protein